MYTSLKWLTCLCFIFGTDNLCNGKMIEHRNVTIQSKIVPRSSRYSRSLPLNNSCTVDEFNCKNGVCIDSSEVCDGRANCSDDSDETYDLCTQIFPRCQSYLFRCNYGACVDRNSLCNGIKDCVDGSDENLPECHVSSQGNNNNPHQFNGSTSKCQLDEYACEDGQCIRSTAVCDGTQDCNDGSDETLALCKSFSCPKYAFKCRYGACVSKASKCDGIKHCADGSDEDICSTTKPLKVTKPLPISTTTMSYPITNKKCTLPSTEGIVYSYNNSNNVIVLSSGMKVNQYTVVDVNCKDGYYKNSVLILTMICMPTGQWSSTFTDLCLKMCPPVTSDSLDISCTLNGEPVDCKKPSIPGTKLKPTCKPNYGLPNGRLETPIQLQCRNNGTWFGGKLYTCIPRNICGQIFTQIKALITNGANAQYGSAPWNVGVYRLNDNMDDYDMICGGTLISSNLVISAAHCFWQEGSNNRIFININGQYKVAVGKYARDIKVMDNDFTQIIDVGLIYIKNGYNGSVGYHTEDLAVIVLSTKVKMSNIVLPVCIDWNKKYSLPNGSTGKIVGWGNTEKMIQSQILLETYLPIIDQITCRNMYTNGFQYFVTSDKFCAGSQLGQGVHEGDSGAGLTHAHGISHYLTGVVSVKDPMTDDSLAVFTNVSYHIGWIHDIFMNNSYRSDDIFL